MAQHCDTWHQLEAADERAWLDAWARTIATQHLEPDPASKPGFEEPDAAPVLAGAAAGFKTGF